MATKKLQRTLDPARPSSGPRAKYPTGALATLEFDGRWRPLGPGGARLTDFVTPKQLR